MKKLLLIFFLSFTFLFLFSETAKAADAPICIDPTTGTNNVNDFLRRGNGFIPCGNATSYNCKFARSVTYSYSSILVNSGPASDGGPNGARECRARCTRYSVGYDIGTFDHIMEGLGTTFRCICKVETTTPTYQYDNLSIEASSIQAAQTICNRRGVVEPPAEPSPKITGSRIVCPCELRHIFITALKVYNFIVWMIALPLAGLTIVIGGVLILFSGGPSGRNPVTGVISPNLYSTAKNMIWGAVIGLILVFGSWLIIDFVLRAIGYILPWNVF